METAKLHQDQVPVETIQKEAPKNNSKSENSFVSKDQKQLQNKLKKVEELISDLEQDISNFEQKFGKENPSEKDLETYNSKKQKLEDALAEWEYLAEQLS